MEYNEKKIKGHIIRSRVPHMEECESSISYYTKLEKRKGEENMIFSLENEVGQIQEGTDNIKRIYFKFLSTLYKNEPEIESYQDDFLEQVDTFLTTEERESLESAITKEEIRASLNNLQANKTPGSDGLPK